MNHEESRLRTFRYWQTDAPVDAASIARAGFFYTGQGLEVQCFSCGGKISEWTYGDQVMTKHRRLDSRCPFIVNPATSGNVPKLGNPTAHANNIPPQTQAIEIQSSSAEGDGGTYLSESSRLQTYVDWPVTHVVTPDNLAKAGFYSLQQGDKVKCAYCNGVVGFWEIGDDPKNEHRRHFPQCSFVLFNFETPATTTTATAIHTPANNAKLVSSDLQELGIQTHKGPRQPRYSTLESRLRTFINWPVELIQTPDMLSEAGFYYVGTGDQVRCFHCDGGLRHWDPQDEPWVEHARWFPSCAFLRLVKGAEFVTSCNPTEQGISELINPARPNRSTPFTRIRDVTEQDVQAYMTTAPALAALSIGLHVGRVKQAVRHKMEQTGVGYTSADALIEAALNLQLEESESNDPEISEEVSRILSTVLIQNDNDSTQVESKPRLTEEVTEPVTQPVASVSHSSLEEENRLLREARLCKICMDNEIGVVFLPCGHLTTCVNCAPSLKDCPVCRSIIKATVRTFLS